ncbi:RNA-binding protein [Candidatus Nomurabacteria bacterium]|uniref:RNA-binding protein n=1 Tax=candidate division WWE3 bacterium TaxID=2053526 RepID=A0A955DZX4_UNCKA|nr:RNA-binding protein [candidate division WWE3 bacterium]MCB9824038.1 RNA-binding protein [Candidatus Nomurabacteria bacterium]MCB9826991.1 RNA-binding protein [Candidatus Nomurabacteria bacterium]MCB9827979.1 RNA-binding protein [Candidatus Nomurabacteria bacterium]HXK52680.1 RNA-binding protein [bacterium]
MKKLYVGNLPYKMDDDALAQLFSQVGNVISAFVIKDRATGRSKGFGFVEMDDADADAAILQLNDKEVEGRALKVTEAKPQEDRPRKDFRKRY